MGWKQKEKELSVEEAIELARRELEPYWFGSRPLIIGIQSGGQFVTLPLDPEFPNKAWLIFCVDLTDFTSETVFYFAREWNRRYHSHHLRILIIIATRYDYLKKPDFYEKIKEKRQLDFPLTIDIQETLFPAFGVSQYMKILLQRGVQRHFEHDQSTCFKQSEAEIQHFLRSTDPGLSLPPLLKPSQPIQLDIDRYEFGYRPKIGKKVTYLFGDFGPPNEAGERSGLFEHAKLNTVEPGEFHILGNWTQNAECITTNDPYAQICFHCPSSELGIVARAVHPKDQPRNDTNSSISFEINGENAYDAIMGSHLIFDETGLSVLRIDQPMLYHALTQLPAEPKEITLRFPNADRAPVEIYGLRFGEIQ